MSVEVLTKPAKSLFGWGVETLWEKIQIVIVRIDSFLHS